MHRDVKPHNVICCLNNSKNKETFTCFDRFVCFGPIWVFGCLLYIYPFYASALDSERRWHSKPICGWPIPFLCQIYKPKYHDDCHVLTKTDLSLKRHVVFYKKLTLVASLKRRRWGLGIPTRIKVQSKLMNIDYYTLLVLNRVLYLDYIVLAVDPFLGLCYLIPSCGCF